MILKLVHITLALLLFFSSTGMTVHSHFCKEKLKDISIFFKAESCHTKSKKASCYSHSNKVCQKQTNQVEFKHKKCCADQVAYAQADLDSTLDAPISTNMQLVAIVPKINFIIEWIENNAHLSIRKKGLRYYNYKAPPPLRNIYLHNQVFRC